MRVYSNDYRGLRSGLILREAGVGGSNPLTPTNDLNTLAHSSPESFVQVLHGD